MNQALEPLVKKANQGNKEALEAVVTGIRDLVYNLSLKMLLFPEDAEDASQEILIRIVTRLNSFNHQSKFTTWVYRVATNYLLTEKGKMSKTFAMDFQDYERFIDEGQSDHTSISNNAGELLLLEEEVKVSCTQGLLLCLDPSHRITYILGEILGFNSKEGAAVLSISSDAFRQQLSRSRSKIRNFLNKKCGLVNQNNPCRCMKKIDFLANQKLIDPKRYRFARFKERSIDLMHAIGSLESDTSIHRTNPDFRAPEQLSKRLETFIASI